MWEALPAVTRWWYALTKTMGPAPPLAPGMLAQSALMLLLATFVGRGAGDGVGHRRGRTGEPVPARLTEGSSGQATVQ
ncbi:hypothetical protein GCM10020216_090730 [Nonomuraea helvata]